MTTVEDSFADMASLGLVSPQSLQRLRKDVGSLCHAILPDVIGLTDAFGFDDWELDSRDSLLIELLEGVNN